MTIDTSVFTETADARAGSVPLTVVAAAKRGHWIVRAMCPFASPHRLRLAVERYVGTLDPEIKWTSHTYEGWPGYVVYGHGDLPRLGWPTGVYRFDWTAGDDKTDCYRGDPVRLGDVGP